MFVVQERKLIGFENSNLKEKGILEINFQPTSILLSLSNGYLI